MKQLHSKRPAAHTQQKKKKHGFSLVEVMVVVIVIAILSGIVTVIATSSQRDARDSARKASVAAVAESLEKYYQDNGEYPSVNSIASSTGRPVNEVKNTLNIMSGDLLVFPNSTDATRASITTGTASTSRMKYETTCAATAACGNFTLTYLEEGASTPVTINSRAVVAVQDEVEAKTLAQATRPSVSSTLAGRNVTITATGSACTVGQAQYRVRSASTEAGLSSATWSSWLTTVPATRMVTVPPATSATSVYFNAKARCALGSTYGAESPISSNGIRVVPPLPTTPTAPVLTAPAVGGSAWTWTRPACNAGTADFQFNRIKSGDGSWATSYTAAVSGTYGPVSEQGSRYRVIVRARCVSGTEVSGWSSDNANNDKTVTVPVTAITRVWDGYSELYASGNAILGRSTVIQTSPACPVGTTTVFYQIIHLNDPDDGSQPSGPSDRAVYIADWGAAATAYYMADLDGNNSNALYNDKLEFMWWTRCQNIYTGLFGPQRYSDIFGNARVVENRNVGNGKAGRWDRTCVGGSQDNDGGVRVLENGCSASGNMISPPRSF